MVDSKVWQEEVTKLESVMGLVHRALAEARRLAGEHEARAKQERRSLWEDGPRQVSSAEEWIELAQATTHLGQRERSQEFYRHQARRFERMLDAPYFGRMDYREEGVQRVEQVYVGIGTLTDEQTGDLVVFDWRAPICSLFYDAEPGPVQYTVGSESVNGEVLLKRQFKITKGQLQYLFDTDLKIDDEVLQELLGRNVDDKMRTIVTSIQREQNRAIRDGGHDLLLVQGPAGSGKTAIALHRAAYLLYKYRDSLTAKDIVIFSPNRVFSDYISTVLPELGEENVVQTTFHEYSVQQLGARGRVENVYAQLEYLLTAPHDKSHEARVASIKYKASDHFAELLHRYVAYIEEGRATRFADLAHRNVVVVSGEEIAELFTARHRDLPHVRRLEKIRQRILFLLEPLEQQRRKELQEQLAAGPDRMFDWEIRQESRRRTQEEFRSIKDAVGQWASFDLMKAYCSLFRNLGLARTLSEDIGLPDDWDIIRRLTLDELGAGRIRYEDVTPLLYLQRALEGAPLLRDVRHVIIDESQDYLPLQYELLGMVFPRSSLTVVGDLDQSVHPYMRVGSHERIMASLQRENAALVRLTNGYRSTQQIMAFARQLLANPDGVEVVRREGPKPRVTRVADTADLIGHLIEDIRDLRERGRRSVAVLCRTAAEAREVFEAIKRPTHAHLLTAEDQYFRPGVLILPVYLAKGLEFDAVIVHDIGGENYLHERERGMLYTAFTRALHELHVYYVGDLTPFLRPLDTELCELGVP